ncbi:hypothetical protein [Isoptericola sp. NPDC019482]|uniref:phage terminase small subunit n=1 Tax=Isoptericola sp. NPDC019482 TaxID=3154688 RepID=UPI003485B5BA
MRQSFDWPEPDESWSYSARLTWDSCLQSGQAGWYQASDVATLYRACSLIDRQDKSDRPSAYMEATVQSMLSRLLVSVGDRRNARVELVEYVPDDGPRYSLESLGVADVIEVDS